MTRWTEQRKIERKKLAKKLGYGKWNIGKKHSKESIEKMKAIQSKLGFRGKKADWNGKKHTEESKQKMRLAKIGKKISEETKVKIGVANTGSKSHLWKGGITKINQKIRTSKEYKLWRKSILERDKYQCIWCGSTENLEVDHIKPFSLYPELRFAIDNGRTLCHECHKTTETYAGKCRQRTLYNRILKTTSIGGLLFGGL